MKQNFTVRQGALDGVEVFLRVAQHRSFRKAAAELGVTPSAISQTVRVLETRIGAALFIRNSRSVGLTEAGEQFFARAKPAFEELVAASEVARGLGQRPAGLLRLSAPRAVIPTLLELVTSFCRAYPEIEVELAASKEVTDLAAEGFDAAIRQGHLVAPDMVAVPMTPPFRLIVVGSPDYLAGLSLPAHPNDLRQHACLRWRRSNGALALWSFNDDDQPVEIAVSGPLIASDFPTVLGAAIEGLGLAQVPEPLAAVGLRSGELIEVLAAYAPMRPGMFLCYPGRRQAMPKLRAFIDHMKSRTAVDGKARIQAGAKRAGSRKGG
ncbi:LysR family transcriptional regulator [Paraburkholderia guartelaensis]|jgi:DNA-binding transcriptional LysR family regulator|uniref:LysR family transcriptional regulator n=1 Tax=Paraburkholderia guartelaensis TaxID=2546446 RepID=A0A4R5L6K6_9BURK|nr:LysR family transcriptional regulator [Paraburkholderia guartelaensis]TDG04444.1 LysR family transcriptional regulator [Paraburkholderia guartelaensis]